MSIISFDLPNARHRYRSPQRCRVLVVQLLSIARHDLSIARHDLSIARHYLSIARHCYRLPAIIIERPPQNSIAVQRQSSQQLINNDNRDRVGESAAG